MTTTKTQGILPKDFFTYKTFNTLAGSAGAVWLICAVIPTFFPPHSINCYVIRIIAFSFSLLISIIITLRNNVDDLEWFAKSFITFLNSLLIFINASGINAVSTGTTFSSSNQIDSMKSQKTESSILPFNEISWWPDIILVKKVSLLQKEINKQQVIISNLKKQNFGNNLPDIDNLLGFEAIPHDNANDRVFEYDSLGRIIKSKDTHGNIVYYFYDSINNIIQTQNAFGHRTSYSYDSAGRKVSKTDPLGAVTNYRYDAAGNLIMLIDSRGGTTMFAYDALNRLVSMTNALGNTIYYEYDSNGKRIIKDSKK